MRKIAVALSKGGVGKTTTAVNLAHGLALAGQRVLLVDADVQGQASVLLGFFPEYSLSDLVEGKPEKEVVIQARENLDLVGGGDALAGLNRAIARQNFGGEYTIGEALGKFDSRYDFVVVDTAPGYDTLMINALFYVNEILCPISLQALSLNGVSKFAEHVENIARFKPGLDITYVLPTFYDRRVSQSDEILGQVRSVFGDKTLEPIRYNSVLAELVLWKKTIFEMDPKSKGAQDYYALTKRILEHG